MIDYLPLFAAVALVVGPWLVSEIAYRRRPPVVAPARRSIFATPELDLEPTELPWWASTPGPAQWDALAARPAAAAPPPGPYFELPPVPIYRRQPSTLQGEIAAAYDSWERRTRRVYVVAGAAA